MIRLSVTGSKLLQLLTLNKPTLTTLWTLTFCQLLIPKIAYLPLTAIGWRHCMQTFRLEYLPRTIFGSSGSNKVDKRFSALHF